MGLEIKDLVVYKPPQPTELDAAQKQLIFNLATDYTRRNNIPFTRANLRRAVEVLEVDALPRGIALSGLEKLPAKPKIRELIQVGIKHRGQVKERIKTIFLSFPDKLDIHENFSDFYGPLAIDKKDSKQLAPVLNSFALTADISLCDTLTFKYLSRRASLPYLASFTLSLLPKDLFPQASLEAFPKEEEQAKIVRNMILGLVMNNSPIPLISIEQALDFLADQKREQKFNAASLEVIPIHPDLKTIEGEVKSYLQDLKLQLSHTFQKITTFNPKYNAQAPNLPQQIREKDAIYHQLSEKILIRHPALEEAQLATTATQANIAEHSLWGDGLAVEVLGFQIPSPDALNLAIRQAQVKSSGYKRLGDARQAWYILEKNEEWKIKRIASLNTDLAHFQKLLIDFQKNPDSVDYKSLLGDKHFYSELVAIQKQAALLNRYQRYITEAKKIREDALEYQKVLESSQASVTEAPDSVQKLQANKARRAQKYSKTYQTNKLAKLDEVLKEDIFSQIEKPEFVPAKYAVAYWLQRTPEDITAEIIHLEQTLADILQGKKPPVITLSVEQILVFLKNYHRTVTLRYNQYYRRYHLDKNILEEITDTQGKIRRVPFNKKLGQEEKQAKINQLIYNFSLSNRISTLQEILNTKYKLSLDQPQPDKINWSKKKAKEWVKFNLASTFDQGLPTSTLRQQLQKLQTWFREFDKLLKFISHPARFQKDDFMEFINEQLEIQTKTPHRVGPYKYREVLQGLSTLKELVGSDILPTEEGEGLYTSTFFEASSKRMKLIRDFLEAKDLREKIAGDKSKYEDLQHLAYEAYLIVGIKNTEAELEKIQQQNPQASLVKTMQLLDLALPIS